MQYGNLDFSNFTIYFCLKRYQRDTILKLLTSDAQDAIEKIDLHIVTANFCDNHRRIGCVHVLRRRSKNLSAYGIGELFGSFVRTKVIDVGTRERNLEFGF